LGRGQLGTISIHPFLGKRAFEAALITQMAEALTRVCCAIGLSEVDDLATRTVAAKIIELAQRGISGVDELSERAIRELSGRD
jgi:hypothetical protein